MASSCEHPSARGRYHWALTQNPSSVWVDHQGVHIANWGARLLHGVWRASCDHLKDEMFDESPVRQMCRPMQWTFHFSGAWRAYCQSAGVNITAYFGVSSDDIFGTDAMIDTG